MMKMAYIYQESRDLSKANVYQSSSMVKAFSLHCEVDWYRGWNKLKFPPEYDKVNQKRILNIGLFQEVSFILEKISRLIFSIHTMIMISQNKPDVIFTRDFGFLLFYSYLPRWLKTPCPIIFEAHKVYHRVSEKVSKEQEGLVISSAQFIVAVSSGIKDDLISDFKINSNNIRVEANGIEPTLELQMSNHDGYIKNFVYAGSLESWKGVDTLIEASQLLNDFSGKVYIIGGEEDEQMKFRKEIPEFVYLLPRMSRSDLFPLLTTMDVGLIPTLDEIEGSRYTSPIKFFEYIQCGLSILASDTYAMKSIEALGFKMEFFKVGDAHSLASNIQKMAGQPQNSNLIRHNSDLIKSFSWQKRAERIIENYRIIDTST